MFSINNKLYSALLLQLLLLNAIAPPLIAQGSEGFLHHVAASSNI